MQSNATYMRIKDTVLWGLRVEGDCSPGMRVSVTRRDGTVRDEIIGRILWQKNGVYGAAIATTEETARLAARPMSDFDSKLHRTKPLAPLPPDDGTIPFDPPYVSAALQGMER